MPSIGDKAGEGDEPQEPPVMPQPLPQHQQQHQQHLLQMTMHVYPFPHALGPTQQPPLIRAKRRQVKNACTNCQKACKKCDDARPCLRCVKYGISDDCVDSQRKERKRGVKRGPYKKRDGKGSHVDQDDVPELTRPKTASDTVPPRAGEASTVPGPCLPMGYSQGYYGHYPPSGAHTANKPADNVQVCAPGPQPYFLAPVPQHVPPQVHPIQSNTDSDHGYPTQSFYQHTLLPPMPYHPHPQYPIIRPDNASVTSVHVPGSYPIYPLTVYPKQTVGGQTELIHPSRNPNERPGLVINSKQG